MRRVRAEEMDVGREEEMVTRAEDSMLASATAKPMPEVPPMIRTCLPASLVGCGLKGDFQRLRFEEK